MTNIDCMPVKPIDWSKAQNLDTQAKICAIGKAIIDEVGSENVYIVKDSKPYYFKAGNTRNYRVGEHDFSKDNSYDEYCLLDFGGDPSVQRMLTQDLLKSLIDDYSWENQGSTIDNLFWVTKNIGGGYKCSLNEQGIRRLSAKFDGAMMTASHGDAVLVSVLYERSLSAKDNAYALDAAVKAIDLNQANERTERRHEIVKAQSVRRELAKLGYSPSDNGVLMTRREEDLHISVETKYRKPDGISFFKVSIVNSINADAESDIINGVSQDVVFIAQMIDKTAIRLIASLRSSADEQEISTPNLN